MTDPITAVLDQLAAHAEQIERLDARQAGDHADAVRRIAALAGQAAGLRAQLTAKAGDPGPGKDSHRLPAAGRWEQLAGQDREQAVARLRAWVEHVYRPGYGRLAASLGSCWEQHALCLYALDILAGLWQVLYGPGERTAAIVSAQAEFQARIVPALAEQMTAETSRCRHARERLSGPGLARRTP